MKSVARIATTVAVATVVAVASLPPLAYWLALKLALPLPSHPAPLTLSLTDRLTVWRSAGGCGGIGIAPLSPWTYLIRSDQMRRRFLRHRNDSNPPCNEVAPGFGPARAVAKAALRNRHYARWRWHIAVQATTLWLSRNWSADQLVDALASEATHSLEGDYARPHNSALD